MRRAFTKASLQLPAFRISPSVSAVLTISRMTRSVSADGGLEMGSWIQIEAFGLFSAKASGDFAITALTVIVIVYFAFRIILRLKR